MISYARLLVAYVLCIDVIQGADPGPPSPDKDKATKEEYNIARWMRNNVPVKKTKFLSHTVEYFTGNKNSLSIFLCSYILCYYT